MDDVMRAQTLLHQAFPDLTHEGKGRVERAMLDAWAFLRPRVEPRINRRFTLRRVRALHEGAAKRVDGAELNALEQAKIEEARRERARIRNRLDSLERMLAAVDADLACAPSAPLGSQADGQGLPAPR